MHRLQKLTGRVRKAYEDYEFYSIYHAVNKLRDVDLSAFYHDVLKDRLYTSAPKSLSRRSARRPMFSVLDAMVRLLAPILAFTAEEGLGAHARFPRQAESVLWRPAVRERKPGGRRLAARGNGCWKSGPP
jgi:isoleucyl-tRNA synthetase